MTRLPIQPEALPLLLVAKGPQERALVEFLVHHFQAYPRHIVFLRDLHAQLLLEVLRMKKLTPEQIGIDYQALLDLIGEERALDLIGEERAIEILGEERLAEDLLRRKGAPWLRAILERFPASPDAVEPSAQPAPPEA